jgi:hypothetical protein
MRILLDRLENELTIEVTEYEIWNNESHYRLLENYLKDKDCPGVPVFVNTQSGVILCGEVTYQLLRSWAMGGNVVQ